MFSSYQWTTMFVLLWKKITKWMIGIRESQAKHEVDRRGLSSRVWLNGERKSPTSLYQNDQRKRGCNTLPVWFESETLHVSVVGVRWKYSADWIRSNSISLDSKHAWWWIFKQGWKRSLYGAWNLFDKTHPHCDTKWEGVILCLLAWWCLVPSAHTTAPSLYSVSAYVVVVV